MGKLDRGKDYGFNVSKFIRTSTVFHNFHYEFPIIKKKKEKIYPITAKII